ncbi:MAG: hypothetical protein EA383_02405 [Spirochaetaceae bacterium]|nr:MAG: hypothetical protein EA383_02405 [Spirochaetaceae bacterium]
MNTDLRRIALRLASVTGILMLVQSLTGIIFFDLYRDGSFALQAWRINDPVTLAVAVPVLAVSLILARRESLRGFLLMLGVMQYAFYNYAFYLFGAVVNIHFLLYVSLAVLSGIAFLTGLLSLDVPAVRASVSPKAPTKPVAAYMFVWAAVLGVAWVAQSLAVGLTGIAPEIGEEPFRLIAALDLLFVVTPVAFGAVWLWKRSGWGLVIAIVMNVKGAIYASILLTAGIVWGGDDLIGLWAFFVVGSLLSLFGLMKGMSERGVDA